MDDELSAACADAVGTSQMDQLATQLTDLADAMGGFRARLLEHGFPKTRANEMAGEWFSVLMWNQVNSSDEDE